MKTSHRDEKKIDKKVNKISLGLLSKHISFWLGRNAIFKFVVVLKCIIFCAMRRLYFESGLEELKKRSKKRIPQADIIQKRIKRKKKEEIIAEFMKIQDELLSKFRKLRLLTRKIIVLIDKTEIPYWGDKNDEGVVGTKKQKGTSYCFKYITIHALIRDKKICLHGLPVTAFSDNAKQVDELLSIAKKKVDISLVLVDREFANSKVIEVFEKHGLKYLAPITKNDKIERILKEAYWKREGFYGKYEFDNGITTTVFFTKNKNKEFPAKIDDLYLSWCTNLNVNDKNRKCIAEIYGRRWNIENFYRDGKGNFLIKTKTKIFKVRLFFSIRSNALQSVAVNQAYHWRKYYSSEMEMLSL
ncbi:MAG: transposase [Candidatus Thermoplasmatota archaeon]